MTEQEARQLIGKTITVSYKVGNPEWTERRTGRVLEVGTHYPDEPGREFLILSAPAIPGLSSNVTASVGLARIEQWWKGTRR
jgi:hypothetical protein